MLTNTNHIWIAGVLAAAMFAGVAGPRAAPAGADQIEVDIDQFAFWPQKITVKAGTTVTWVNEDDTPHTVAASSRLFRSKALDTQDKFSFTFTTPGTYEYFCSLHPHMTGTIAAEAATGSGGTD